MYWKLFSLKYCKIFTKLSITEIDCNNAGGAALLKSISTVDILIPILQEFRNIFLKEHLGKAAVATCTCFNVMTLHSSSHHRCSVKMAILKNSAISTGKHLCWNLFLIKLQAFTPATLLKLLDVWRLRIHIWKKSFYSLFISPSFKKIISYSGELIFMQALMLKWNFSVKTPQV